MRGTAHIARPVAIRRRRWETWSATIWSWLRMGCRAGKPRSITRTRSIGITWGITVIRLVWSRSRWEISSSLEVLLLRDGTTAMTLTRIGPHVALLVTVEGGCHLPVMVRGRLSSMSSGVLASPGLMITTTSIGISSASAPALLGMRRSHVLLKQVILSGVVSLILRSSLQGICGSLVSSHVRRRWGQVAREEERFHTFNEQLFR